MVCVAYRRIGPTCSPALGGCRACGWACSRWANCRPRSCHRASRASAPRLRNHQRRTSLGWDGMVDGMVDGRLKGWLKGWGEKSLGRLMRILRDIGWYWQLEIETNMMVDTVYNDTFQPQWMNLRIMWDPFPSGIWCWYIPTGMHIQGVGKCGGFLIGEREVVGWWKPVSTKVAVRRSSSQFVAVRRRRGSVPFCFSSWLRQISRSRFRWAPKKIQLALEVDINHWMLKMSKQMGNIVT